MLAKTMNKRPMGHITHLRKQFKSIIITLIKRRKKNLLILWEFISSSFEETWIPFIQGCFVLRLIEIGSVVLKKRIFIISSMYFHYFVIISLRKRTGPLIWIILNPLHPRMHCAKFSWNWLSGSGKEDF